MRKQRNTGIGLDANARQEAECDPMWGCGKHAWPDAWPGPPPSKPTWQALAAVVVPPFWKQPRSLASFCVRATDRARGRAV